MKIILSTFPTLEGAESLAKMLLDKKIVVCVQIQGPVQSMYNWENKLISDQEWKMSLKTKDDNVEEISKVLHEVHPYEIP
jgi:periplasmic divalent cation tolerance protein